MARLLWHSTALVHCGAGRLLSGMRERNLHGNRRQSGLVGRVRGHRRGHAGDRPVRGRRRQGAPRQLQGGRHLVGDLDQPVARLCRRPVVAPRWRHGARDRQHQGAGIRHRLPDREGAGGRQRFHLADAVQFLRGAGRTAETRSALRRARRHHHAHRHDLRRRLADYPVPLDPLPLRRLPADHRGQDVLVRRREAGPREQQAGEMAARPHEHQHRVRRRALLHLEERRALRDARCSWRWCWSRSPT